MSGKLQAILVSVVHDIDLIIDNEAKGRVSYVQELVDLALSTVLAEETTEDAHAADPHDLGGETSLLGTTALTEAHVTTLTLSSSTLASSETGVHDVREAADITILHQLTNVLTGGSILDGGRLVRVEPNLTLTATKDSGSQTLLKLQAHHVCWGQKANEKKSENGSLHVVMISEVPLN